jgi:hypothetical protein
MTLTKLYLKFSFIFICISLSLNAQNLSVVSHSTTLTDTLNTDIEFAVDVTNISGVEQTVFLVRTINILPPNWTSALCFDYCFEGSIDSIATTATFQSNPFAPGETRRVSAHVFPYLNPGTANIQIQIGTFANPEERFTFDSTAIVEPTSTGNQNNFEVSDYYLGQNYPNPFNPSTQIKFGLKESDFVTLKIFNILGNELSTVVHGYKSAGNHTVNFDASGLSSGVYFYRITAGNYSEIRKMILEK